LITPEAAEADRGAQLKQFCALRSCNRERLRVTLLSGGPVAGAQR